MPPDTGLAILAGIGDAGLIEDISGTVGLELTETSLSG